MCSIPSLPLFQGLLWPEVVVPVRVPSMDQIELFKHLLRISISFLELYISVNIIRIKKEFHPWSSYTKDSKKSTWFCLSALPYTDV